MLLEGEPFLNSLLDAIVDEFDAARLTDPSEGRLLKNRAGTLRGGK